LDSATRSDDGYTKGKFWEGSVAITTVLSSG